MYKRLFTWLAMVGICLALPAQSKQHMKTSDTPKALVTYFSATGNTARAARLIAAATGADLYEIRPAQTYTEKDLDWHDAHSRSSVEMKDPKARPAIQTPKADVEAYDVIFIGYPIWWDLAPRIINTFIESHNLKGKTVVPFATSGSSSITNSAATLKKDYPDLNWKAGKLLNRATEKTVSEWVENL